MNLSYENLSNKELARKLKSHQKSAIIHGAVVVLLFVTAGYKTFVEGFSFYTFLPLFFLPMQIYMYSELRKMKKELLKRKQI